MMTTHDGAFTSDWMGSIAYSHVHVGTLLSQIHRYLHALSSGHLIATCYERAEKQPCSPSTCSSQHPLTFALWLHSSHPLT